MIIKKRNLFPDLPVNRFNVAAWQDKASNHIYLVTREVKQAAVEGEPDSGSLVLLELNVDGNVVHERTIWEPTNQPILLEDPRALMLEDGSILIGLTAVIERKYGYYPYPAVTRLKTHPWKDVLPAITLIETFGPGKNLTPIDEYTYLFRPDNPDYNHKLIVFSFIDLLAKKISELEFPKDITWASWRIGTTMSPLWIEEDKALMIFHGINKNNGKYIYSLGRAGLVYKNGKYELKVSKEPIVTPDDFIDSEGRPAIKELHPELRRVVYACGGLIKSQQPDRLFLYINVGDSTTFEVEFSLSDLISDLF